MDPLVRAAVHEAGHVCIAARRGFKIERCTIEPTLEYAGRTVLSEDVDPRTERGLEVLLAGSVAEFILRSGSKPPEARPGPWTRQASPAIPGSTASDIAKVNDADRAAADVEAARRRVGYRLVMDWAAVRAIADALLRHGTLREWTVTGVLIDAGVLEPRGGLEPSPQPGLLRYGDARRILRRHLHSAVAAKRIASRLPRVDGAYIAVSTVEEAMRPGRSAFG